LLSASRHGRPDRAAATSAVIDELWGGLAYIVLTVALYHPALARFRRLTRWALIALTAATIVAYFALIQGQYDAMGVGDKIAEVVLIALLVVEGRRDRAGTAAADADRYAR